MSPRTQLKGIVAIWLTNGQQPVDGANDTRYDFFDGSWLDAANATEELINIGLLDAPMADDEVHDISKVVPTAKGIFEAIS